MDTSSSSGFLCIHAVYLFPSLTFFYYVFLHLFSTQLQSHMTCNPKIKVMKIGNSVTKCKIMPSFYEAHGDCSEINEALCLHYT